MRIPFLLSRANQSQNCNQQKVRKIPVFLTMRLAKGISASRRVESNLYFFFRFILFFSQLSPTVGLPPQSSRSAAGRSYTNFVSVVIKRSNSSVEKPQLSCQSLGKKGRQSVGETWKGKHWRRSHILCMNRLKSCMCKTDTKEH